MPQQLKRDLTSGNVSSLLLKFAAPLPLILLFVYVFDMGLRGVFLGLALGPLFGMIASFAYMMTGRWKRSRIAQAPLENPIGANVEAETR